MSVSRLRFPAICAGLIIGLALIAPQAGAHGVRGLIRANETLCGVFSYDDGEPMSYAGVKISAPGSLLPFQSGRSDRNGFFCFKPDVPGEWRLECRDEMGHRAVRTTRVSRDMTAADSTNTPGYQGGLMGKKAGAVCGISLIFGLSGSIAWWRSRKKQRKTTPTTGL